MLAASKGSLEVSSIPAGDRTVISRPLQRVKGNLSYFQLADLDMRLQQSLGLVGTPPLNRCKNLSMLFVRRRHAVGLGEIEPANDADAVRDFAMRAHHLAIASAFDDCPMECFVQCAHFHRILQPLGSGHAPHTRE